jgi:lysophospholipase L1-like esterase
MRLLALGVGAAGGLFVAEVSSRLLERHAVPTKVDCFIENPHGTGSYRLKPNYRLRTVVEGTPVIIETNSEGMSWKEVTREKPQGLTRIAFVGDSFTFGNWAPSVAESFVGVVDGELRSKGVEVLNFGVGGYGVDDLELLIQEEVIAFQPDLVVLAFFNGNDFRDTYLGIGKHDVSSGTAVLRPEVILKKVPPESIGDLESLEAALRQKSATDWISRVKDGLRTYSAFARMLERAKDGLLERNGRGKAPSADGVFHVSRDFMGYNYWSQNPYSELAREAKDVTLAILHRIYARLRESSVDFAIVALPYREQVYAQDATGEGFDIGLPQRHLAAFAAEKGVPYLDVLGALREFARDPANPNLYLRSDPHFTASGHRVVGELIANWLMEAVLSDKM